jgi:hypothetical protein
MSLDARIQCTHTVYTYITHTVHIHDFREEGGTGSKRERARAREGERARE